MHILASSADSAQAKWSTAKGFKAFLYGISMTVHAKKFSILPRKILVWLNPVHQTHSASQSSKNKSLCAILLKEDGDTWLKKYIVSKAAKKKIAVSCEILHKNKLKYDLLVVDCSPYVKKDDIRCLELELDAVQTYALTSSQEMLYVNVITQHFEYLEGKLESVQQNKTFRVDNTYPRVNALKGKFYYEAEVLDAVVVGEEE